MKSSNITVYTCITGGKDNFIENQVTGNANFVAFLDETNYSNTWKIKKAYDKFIDPRRNSRIQKILAHQYIDTEYSIYIDGNIELIAKPEELIEKYLGDYDLAVFKHPNRDCLYDEAKVCAVRGLDDPELIIEQAKRYEDQGFAKHKGLAECGMIIRRHTPKVEQFNNAWWSEWCRYSKRDQISFMYALDKVGLAVNIVNEPFVIKDYTSAVRPNVAKIVTHQKYENPIPLQ